MFLVRLIYASKVTSPRPSDGDVDAIMKISREENRKRGVTGMLVYGGDYFLQCLEGSREAVNATYHHIVKDDRHEEIVLLDYRNITRRDFPHAPMGLARGRELDGDTVLQYSIHRTFNPFDMDSDSAMGLLKAVHAKHAKK